MCPILCPKLLKTMVSHILEQSLQFMKEIN